MCLRKLNRVEKATPKKGQNKKKKLEKLATGRDLLSHLMFALYPHLLHTNH